ncbi:MAG: flagellar cap protein FliD N-terminal domain-containing protein, partial [Desulfovibrionaceae bacterium]
MADYLSGGIHFDGIASGTDFGKVVDQLKTVEELPKKRLEAWKSDWNIRYVAFNKVIDSMREAQTKLAAINNPSKFITKTATSGKDSILTAKADATALDSTHTVNVTQMASNSIWAFNGTYVSKNASVNTTGTDQTFSYTYKGKTRDIIVPPGTTLESLTNLVNKDGKNPGVRMNLIQTGGAVSFQLMGKDTGKAAELTVHPNGLTGMSGAKNTWSSPIGDPTKAFTTTTDLKYTVTDTKAGTSKEYIVPSTGKLQDLVNQINTDTPGAATITVKDGKS